MSGSNDTYLDADLGTDAAGGTGSPDSAMDAYTLIVGKRLRTVREQRLYSLQAVERESDHEFKSSVIGAYERGERIMTVQRLERLAQFYDVPITELLPQDDERAAIEVPRPALCVRLGRLNELQGEPFDNFRALVERIQCKRGQHGVQTVTLREQDLDDVASMFSVPAEEMADRLVLLDLLA
ncbi:MAG: helix-turn-helix domain-containing protein [Ilumatobacteraceae bacterium]